MANAHQTYKAKRDEITHQIDRLLNGLAALDTDHYANPRDWGIVGNAGHVSAALADLLDFIEDKPELYFEAAE